MSGMAAADPFKLPPDFPPPPTTRTIIVGARGQYEAIVSEEDYAYLIQWRWTFKISRGGNVYARRGGGYKVGGYRPTILMHDVIMDRKAADGECEPRPTPKHTAHHKNWKTLDYRRVNLEWQDKSGQEKYKRRKC